MHLNESQLRAVTSEASQIVCLAGPGGGKSRTLVERIRRRVANGNTKPSTVCVLTFTQSGAAVFRERLQGIQVGYLGTIHGFCLRILTKHGASIGYRAGAISIVPPEATRQMLQEIATRTKSKLSLKKLMGETEIKPGEALEAARILGEYQAQLKRASMVDYDLILQQGLRIIRSGVELGVSELYVDECQDSAPIDWEIYGSIIADSKFFVGDPDQSIFAFRGAAPERFTNAAKMANWHPDGELIRLERNYRSDIAICEAATRLIRHNTNRVAKDVVPDSKEPGYVDVHEFPTCAAEIKFVTLNCVHRGNIGSIAVLARDNHTAKRFREALQAAGVKVAGSEAPRMPEDWNKALLLASMLNDPNDIVVEAWLRATGVKDVAQKKLKAQSRGIQLIYESGISMNLFEGGLESFFDALIGQGISAESCDLIESRIKLLPQESPTLSDLLADLHASKNWTAQNEDQDGVFVSTLHASKAREFDEVYMVACEEGMLPKLRKDSSLDEERRLAFIGVSRARSWLFVSWAKERVTKWGATEKKEPSRFIAELMPQEVAQ